jgi:hypothetical protein
MNPTPTTMMYSRRQMGAVVFHWGPRSTWDTVASFLVNCPNVSQIVLQATQRGLTHDGRTAWLQEVLIIQGDGNVPVNLKLGGFLVLEDDGRLLAYDMIEDLEQDYRAVGVETAPPRTPGYVPPQGPAPFKPPAPPRAPMGPEEGAQHPAHHGAPE